MTTTAQNLKNKIQKILDSMDGLDGPFAKHEFHNKDKQEDFIYTMADAASCLEELVEIIDADEGADVNGVG